MDNEQGRNEAIESLKNQLSNPTRLISENREAVIVYKDELEAMLEYVAELEDQVVLEPDTTSDLKVGDRVVTLIGVKYSELGAIGVVERVIAAAYPIKVRFKGAEATVGYNRGELGKVRK